jgi:hypothetical protein
MGYINSKACTAHKGYISSKGYTTRMGYIRSEACTAHRYKPAANPIPICSMHGSRSKQSMHADPQDSACRVLCMLCVHIFIAAGSTMLRTNGQCKALGEAQGCDSNYCKALGEAQGCNSNYCKALGEALPVTQALVSHVKY